jgi:hypothetical protein
MTAFDDLSLEMRVKCGDLLVQESFLLVLPYAGVENVRWFCGAALGVLVLVLLKDD